VKWRPVGWFVIRLLTILRCSWNASAIDLFVWRRGDRGTGRKVEKDEGEDGKGWEGDHKTEGEDEGEGRMRGRRIILEAGKALEKEGLRRRKAFDRRQWAGANCRQCSAAAPSL
jgi:hypothetical protein